MKQNITYDQFEKCKNNQKWVKWAIPKGYFVSGINLRNHSLPTIGQMIEFLDENYEYFWEMWHSRGKKFWGIKIGLKDFHQEDISVGLEKKLCDALWEAVKEVLEQ